MNKIELYYDKECPFCQSYSNYISIKSKHEIKLINARSSKEKIEHFRSIGFDINSGMIVVYKSKIYQGAKAAKLLDELVKNDTLFSKIFTFFINSYLFEYFIYPITKIFRLFVLKIQNKNSKI